MKPWFSLSLNPDALRKMTREEYYAAHRWRRMTQRIVRNAMPAPPDMSEMLVYGSQVIYITPEGVKSWP